MHQNNFLFLRHLSHKLDNVLRGFVLGACFSQDKDELMLGFHHSEREFWLRATLTNELSCLSFPEDFARAKRNSVDLFKNFIGKTVADIRQFHYERAFAIVFETGDMLIFKMYGNRANVIAFEKGAVTDIFKNELAKDREITPELLDRDLDTSEEFFLNNGLRKTFPILGQEIADSLCLSELSLEAQYAVVKAFLKKNEQNPIFYVNEKNGIAEINFFAGEKNLLKTDDPIEALNLFFRLFSQNFFLKREREQALRLIEKRRKQIENYLYKAYNRLDDLLSEANYEKTAHIIMANLHQIPERAKEVELFDFYENKNIIVKLKDNLTPAKNAELLYRKAKNQNIETETLQENIQYREKQFEKLGEQIKFIETCDNLRMLRKYLKEQKITGSDSDYTEDFPFKRLDYKGFEIWVGRNAKNNDLLTMKYAHKDDLWLHARDVSGSHVIIKHQSGKPFPQDVIQRAAEIAAYFSKRKNETVCPVIVTPRKFVRKTKGLAEGAVIVEREKVVMAEPKDL
jgi:predicted ribosome quality control (RQC) complex YloA/Tae2 family protein